MTGLHRFSWERSLLASACTWRGRLVGLVLATHYNQRKGGAWPLRETLAQEAGVSLSTVDRGLRELVAEGLLKSEQRGPSAAAFYRFLVPAEALSVETRLDPEALSVRGQALSVETKRTAIEHQEGRPQAKPLRLVRDEDPCTHDSSTRVEGRTVCRDCGLGIESWSGASRQPATGRT